MDFDLRFLKKAGLSILLVALLPGCERYKLDRQMRALCDKDAGVEVYEKIRLSPEEYESAFNYVMKAKSQEDYYGTKYRYVSENEHLGNL